jgi:cytochrome P450 family 9
MSFLAYELVCNPDVQEKLYDEIVKVETELDGKKISYEEVQGLKYLDQCISEILRKWTIAPVRQSYLSNFQMKLKEFLSTVD